MNQEDHKNTSGLPSQKRKFKCLEKRRFILERDMSEVLRLFEQVFGKTANQELWKWKYLPPWIEEVYAWIGVADDQVIAHIGAVPLRGQVDGNEVFFFQFGDIMVDPDFRSYIYLHLSPAKFMEEICLKHPDGVIYGFTGRKLALLYTWFESAGANTSVEWAKDRIVRLPQEGLGGPEPNHFDVHEWSWDAPELDEIWQQQKDTIRVGLIRDRDYLDWRYAKHPLIEYSLFGVYHSGAPVGWLVTGKRQVSDQWDDEVRVHDLLLPNEFHLPALRKAASVLQAKSLVLWLPDNCVTPGFENRDTDWQVMHRSLSSTVSRDFLAGNVYYTLGEADEWWW